MHLEFVRLGLDSLDIFDSLTCRVLRLEKVIGSAFPHFRDRALICQLSGPNDTIICSPDLMNKTVPASSPSVYRLSRCLTSVGDIRPQVLFRRRTHQPNHDAAELGAVLANVPQGSGAADYREAILQRNVLGKTTDSTRQKSLRHLRELYALDEAHAHLRTFAKTPRDRRREPAAAGRPGGLGARSAFASHDPARHGRIRGRTS